MSAASFMAAELTGEAKAAMDASMARIGAASDGVSALVFELRVASLVEVRAYLCCAVRTLAADSNRSSFVPAFLRAGGLEVLLSVIRGTLESPETVAAAFGALANLVPTTKWRNSVADAAIDEALKVLRGNNPLSSCEEVMVSICHFLSNACSDNTRIALNVCDAGAAALLIAAMQRFPSCEELQFGACGALHHCIADAGSAVARKGLSAILAAMAAFPTAPLLLQNCCLALAALVRDNNAIRPHLLQLGGLDAIVNALTVNPEDAGVAESACHALGNLNLCIRPPQVSSHAAQATLDGVLSALRKHAGHLMTQRHGLAALAAVLPHQAVWQRAGSAEAALQLILAAMDTFRGDVRVQSAASLAICSVTQAKQDFRVVAGEAGAVKAVVRVLRLCSAPASQPAVDARDVLGRRSTALQFARKTMHMLLLDLNGFPNQLRAVHAGALSLLQAELLEPGRRDALVEKCICALEKLAAEHEGQQAGGCSNCAGMRANGRMCGLAGCTVRWRANGSSLPLCSGCRLVGFCCREHQLEAWPSHKKACGKNAPHR